METTSNTSKRILLLGINFRPELTGIGKYTGETVDWLIDNGYECTVVTSFPYYPNWEVQAPYSGRLYKKEVEKNGKLHIYRCPLYVPSIPSGGKRVLQELTFFFTSFIMMFYLLFKRGHGQIFCMAPPFHLGFIALMYRFFKGGKILYHIQDLQIEAARDLKVLKSESPFKFLFWLERAILKKVDFVSTVSPGMLKLISRKVNKKILFFPNWADIASLYPVYEKTVLKRQWGFRPEDKVVLYSGGIGEKQGLESLIHIAKNLEWNKMIKFVICGNGPYKEKLAQIASDMRLKNISFLPLQPLSLFNSFLNMADVHLVIQRKEACELMLPSKLTSILSVGGLALVTAEPDTFLHGIIKDNKMGIVIPCEDQQGLQDTLLDCCSADYSVNSANGRQYAEAFLNRDVIIKRILQEIHSIPVKENIPAVDYQLGSV